MAEYILKPIGFVRNEIKAPDGHDGQGIVSRIVIEQHLAEALDGLDGFSHIIVIYWMHRLKPRPLELKVRPMGRKEISPVGLLATRSPYRPNPLGETTVTLLKRKDNVLTVEGLDAVDGTPVIDIKPYLPGNDAVKDARVPSWITPR